MEELTPHAVVDDPRLDAAIAVAYGPEPPPSEAGLVPAGATGQSLLEEILRLEERARAAALRAEEAEQRRKRLLVGGSALLFLSVVVGGTMWRSARADAAENASRADAETTRADGAEADALAGWTRAEEEEQRADEGWEHAASETLRADEGHALAASEGQRADAAEADAAQGWATALEEGGRADEATQRALEEAQRADAAEAMAVSEGSRADVAEAMAVSEGSRADVAEGRADAEGLRANEAERAEAARAHEVLVLDRIAAATAARAAGDAAGAEAAWAEADALAADPLATDAQRARVGELRGALDADDAARRTADAYDQLGEHLVAGLDAARARADLDGLDGAARAAAFAGAFTAVNVDPMDASPDAVVSRLGRGAELARGLLDWAAASVAAGDPEACRALVARAAQLDDGADTRGEAATTLLAAGLPAEAAPHLEAVCAALPDSRGARERLAEARFAAQDFAGAADALADALALGALAPQVEAALRGRRGRALRRAGDVETALTELEAALALAPGLAWLELELAATKLAAGDGGGALDAAGGLLGP